MANNGYLVSGVCVSATDLILSTCKAGDAFYYRNSSGWRLGCTNLSNVYADSVIGAPSCSIANTSLTDVEQIQAVNQILPYALAFLASIWAMKKVFQVLWNSSISFSSKKEQE